MTATAMFMDEITTVRDAGSAPPCDLAAVDAELRRRLSMPVTASSSGVSVELDVPGSWAVAAWTPASGRVEFRAGREAVSWATKGREAVCALLGRAADAVPTVTCNGHHHTLSAAAAPHGEPPVVAEVLVEAFEAMTVAARLVAAEAEVLAVREDLAIRYLEVLEDHFRNRSPQPQKNKEKKQ